MMSSDMRDKVDSEHRLLSIDRLVFLTNHYTPLNNILEKLIDRVKTWSY